MANKITTLIDFKSDDSGIKKIAASVREAEGGLGKLKAGWKGVTTELFHTGQGQAALAGGVATVAAVSMKAASDLTESINAVNVAYGDAAEGVHDLGEASAESLGMSERAFNTFAVQFSAFAQQIAKESGRDVVEVLDEITTRTADFASVNNLAMEEAGTIVMSTLAGETEAFRRYGGDVSAATIKTYAYTHGIAEAGEELTEQQKVLARYGALMEQTDKVAGDFANTSEGLANQQRIAAARTEDLAAALGMKLTPIAADALQTLNDLVVTIEQLNSNTGGSLKFLFDTSGLQGIEALKEIFGGGEKDANQFIEAQKRVNAVLSEAIPVVERYDGAADRASARVARLAEEAAASIPAHQQVADAIAGATAEMEEQNEAARDLREEIKDTTARVYDLHDAELDLEHKIRDAVIALHDEKTTLREARSVIEDVTEAADAQAQKKLELNGITLDSVVGQQMWAESMLETANTMGGPLRDEIIRYVSQITGIPKEVLTQFKPEMDYATLAAIARDLDYAARTRFVRFAPSGTQGGAVIDGPNTDARAGASSVPQASANNVTHIYNSVNVQATSADQFMYDLDRMAKGLG